MAVPVALAPVAGTASPLPAGIAAENYHPLPGRLGNLTDIQLETLSKFKEEIVADGKFVESRMGDAQLLRWLRARKFDIVKAKEMLYATEKWWIDFGVDDVLENFDYTELAEVDKYYPQYYHKTDKEGRPIYIERLGKLNMTALYAATSQERLLKRLVYEYERFVSERLSASSLAHGFPVETSCTILDLSNVSLSNFVRVKDYVSAAANIGQAYYPERMGKFYIINAPWAFSAVWAAIKPWLDAVTVSKVDIIGSSYKDKLLSQIDADNLPSEFGGKCKCVGGCSLADAGPWNPKSADYIRVGKAAGGKEDMPTAYGAESPAGNKAAMEAATSNGVATPTPAAA